MTLLNPLLITTSTLIICAVFEGRVAPGDISQGNIMPGQVAGIFFLNFSRTPLPVADGRIG